MCVHLAELASRRIRAEAEAEVEEQPDWAGLLRALDALMEFRVRYFYAHPRQLALTAAAGVADGGLCRRLLFSRH
ncbi:hypothetical protein S1361_00550 [Streptomyces cyanogenus]|uniref:Uncharacterized protein n=1 Tax=Streptomyces cyanogenus TaxID=80860 RepID=A0ABX7TJP1_STRCY|nr:hypothetical protein S1361_00550 [Streptomyces cyanogenus]